MLENIETMNNYSDQTERIKSKLILAAKKDTAFKAFGANSHRYVLNSPLEIKKVLAFEQQNSINLPESYRQFVLAVGNGGISGTKSGAGPFYGIFPLGTGMDQLVYTNTSECLKMECIISPDMTEEEWSELIKEIEDDDISDEDYENELCRIFGGILPIGSPGCNYLHGLVLNGKYAGKVVNLDQDLQKPHFTYEDNFLDWYERWLDEVISGDLLVDKATWFGYNMGGSEEELLEKYLNESSKNLKSAVIDGLLSKLHLSEKTLESIDEIYCNSGNSRLLYILAKHNHPRWKEYVNEVNKDDLLIAFQIIYWYDKSNCEDWKEFIVYRISEIEDSEVLRFCTYILQECDFDYGNHIKDFINHDDREIRSITVYSLGKLPNKSDYLETFIKGLNDSSNKVIHSSLQALSEVRDKRLLTHYKKIADRFPVEQDYILSNLKHRLSEFRKSLQWLRENDP